MNFKIKLTLVLSLFYTSFLISQNEKLEVDGALLISSNDNPTPDAGTIRWTGTDFEGFDGTNWISFTANGSSGNEELIDIDNNKYETVVIGTQTWMAEELKVTRYNDGTPIPLVIDNAAWLGLTSPGMTWIYNGDYGTPDFGDPKYGGLYNFYVVADTNSLNVCPVGWHVPTDLELTVLIDFVDPGPPVDPNVFGVQSTVAGGALKESGLSHWEYNINSTATNDFGFSMMPSGTRGPNGSFGDHGFQSAIYSSTEGSSNNGIYRYFNFGSDDILRVSLDKRFGFAVRCLKD